METLSKRIQSVIYYKKGPGSQWACESHEYFSLIFSKKNLFPLHHAHLAFTRLAPIYPLLPTGVRHVGHFLMVTRLRGVALRAASSVVFAVTVAGCGCARDDAA